MKEGKLNYYIPQLVNSSKSYIKDFQKKIQLSNYLSNFNMRASKDLNKFINNSTTRYHEVKAGNTIDSTLNQTMKAYSPLSNAILSNKFYTQLQTKNDEEKLKKLIKKGQDNKIIIKQIREEQMKDEYTNIELRFREFLNDLNLEKKGLKKEILNKNEDLNWKIKNLSNYSSEKCKADTIYLEQIIKEDQNLFNAQITQYFNRTNNLKDEIPDLSHEELKKKKQKLLYVNIDNLKMLKYNKPIKAPINLKKNIMDEDEIDLKKFVPYTKSNKQQIEKIKLLRKSNFHLPKTIKYDNLSEDDYSNTRRVVTEEANNLFFLKDKFQKKQKNIMDKVNIEIPDINEYSNVIKQKLKERNLKRISDNYKRAQFLSEDEQKRLNFNLTLKNTFEKWNLDPKELEQLYI